MPDGPWWSDILEQCKQTWARSVDVHTFTVKEEADTNFVKLYICYLCKKSVVNNIRCILIWNKTTGIAIQWLQTLKKDPLPFTLQRLIHTTLDFVPDKYWRCWSLNLGSWVGGFLQFANSECTKEKLFKMGLVHLLVIEKHKEQRNWLHQLMYQE